jgi:Flp pilus assembly protein TadG
VKVALPLRLRDDTRGVTVVEFALIAPALLTVLLGLMDFSYNLYTSTLLEGAIQKAGRDATIEGAGSRSAAIDAKVRSVVEDIVPNADIQFSRKSYTDFSDVAKAEDFTDTNKNDVCDNGEPFEDVNGNGDWDTDRGADGLGGARDAVLYTVTVTYPRAFPLAGLIGLDDTVTARARTVLRNQPFGEQSSMVSVGQCT